jgi:osmotically-inducible protein OsmY
MKQRAVLGIMAVAALSLFPAACRNTAEGVKKDAEENKAAAEQKAGEAKAETADERAAAERAASEAKGDVARAGDAAGDAARNAADKMKDAAGTVGDKVAQGAQELGPTLDAKKQTMDVKAALMADQTVDASHIDVDTDETTRTVHLKGTVPTAAQKAEAEKIAKAKAAGYTIHNALKVAR